jgi:glyceraldehyde-3-phosphate dehydrogenase (NADP+)
MQKNQLDAIFSSGMLPDQFRLDAPVVQKQYLCNGEIRSWEGPSRSVLSPVCMPSDQGYERIPIGSFPLMSAVEALESLQAACDAFDKGRGLWPTMPVAERIKHMETFVFRMIERRAKIVKLLMWEIGKVLPDAEKEFDRTIDYIRSTLDALKELDRTSSRFVIEEGVIGQIRRSPLGVALCMGPFNYPLNETFTTLIPALIMGNTVIFKPPKLGVLLHEPLLEAFRDSFPKGVINTVYGEGHTIITPLMQSGKIDVLAFIGTSRVADILRKQHPMPHRLRCILGLDAKNPAIILKDADLEHTIKECILGALSFNGQRCTALKMFFVHQEIIDIFIQKLCQAVEKLQCGLPWEPGVHITPLPESDKITYLQELITDAEQRGAKVVNESGGRVVQTLMSPAVIYPVKPGMRLYMEEQFGPVLPLVVFKDIEEPVDYILQSKYGQQVSIFGNDPDIIASLIDPLVNQVSRVNINSQCQRGPDTFPFTGRKDSAEGTLSVSDALRVFSIRTLVAAKETEANKNIIRSIVTTRSSQFLSTDFLL